MDVTLKIFCLYFFLIIFFNTEKQIINCLNQIVYDVNYPIIFNVNEQYYNILTQGQYYTINKETDEIESQNDIIEYVPPFLLIPNGRNHYFFYSKYEIYQIDFGENNEIEDFYQIITLTSDIVYYGYIIDKNSSENYRDCLLYGKNSTDMVFENTSEEDTYEVDYNLRGNLGDYLSCKQSGKNKYICAYNVDSYFKISIFYCDTIIKKFNELNNYNEINSGHSEAFLYDTLDPNLKVLCCTETQRINYLLQCVIVVINQGFENDIIIEDQLINLSSDNDNALSCPPSFCNFTQFYSEYLLCCACNNYIVCTRLDYNFQTINTFKIEDVEETQGQNSYPTILNNNDYLSIFFLNERSNSLCKKNIYPPNCKNISKDIQQEIEINFQDLFIRKPDSIYFVTFDEFDIEKITIKSSNNLNVAKNIKYLLNVGEYNYTFTLNNNDILDNNLYINYTISIEETYNDTCSIDLIIKHPEYTFITWKTEYNYNVDSTNIICYPNCKTCNEIIIK